jgi:hypothetical protein
VLIVYSSFCSRFEFILCLSRPGFEHRLKSPRGVLFFLFDLVFPVPSLLRSCSAGRLCSRFLSDLQSDFSVRILRAPSPSWAATGFAFPSRAVLVGLRLLTKSSLRFDSRLVYVAGLSPHIHSADTWSLSLLGSPSPVSILVFPQSIS